MNVRLDWQIGDDGSEPEGEPRRWSLNSLATIITAIALLGLALGAWGTIRYSVAQSEAELKERLQTLLDLERRAFLRGDGDLFFANLQGDSAWFSAQLRPEMEQVYRAGLTVTEVNRQGDDIWANLTWLVDGQTWQRIAFFRQQGGRLVRVAADEDYWGPWQSSDQPWGELRFHQRDQRLIPAVAAEIRELVVENCGEELPGRCDPDDFPFTISLADDYDVTAAPGQIKLPSPRLLALDLAGQPGDLFTQRLNQELVAHLKPAQIRFAVPVDPILGGIDPVYEQLAAEFSQTQPDISVEIVSLADLPGDPALWSAEVDGAAVTPTEAMLAAGLVYDLTNFVQTDPNFDLVDFYEQIWQGAWWRDRMWLMPEGAGQRLLFYDREAYRAANLAEPSLRWTWAEMEADIAVLAGAAAQGSTDIEWAFLDASRDILFSYAFNWENRCPGRLTIECAKPLTADRNTAAYTWYQGLARSPGNLAPLTSLSDVERRFRVVNLVAPRKVAIWTEEPVYYEQHALRQATGLTTFPGSERFDGATPLWVEGSLISQSSDRPRATWEWLKFLSYQNLARQKRLIPARPSVAESTGYWATLPRPLGEAMRVAFPSARPVLIAEQGLFGWDLLGEVAEGRLSPAEAAADLPRLNWFGAVQAQ